MNSPYIKNIQDLPVTIQPVINEFVQKLIVNGGDNICSIVVYGSAAGVNFQPGVSNINVGIILKNLDFNVLRQNISLIKWCHKNKMATPLFLTLEYIQGSLDVFPIEYNEIKQQHKTIFGEDLFSNLEIPSKDIRLLCEQQIKGKLLRLRQAYLEIGPHANLLKNLLKGAFSDLMPIFRQMIILKGQKDFESKEEMLKQLAHIYSLDLNPFLAVYHDKSKKLLISSQQVEAHFQNFLNQLESLSRHLDSL